MTAAAAIVALAIAVGALVWGAASDLARHRIPNWVSVVLVAAYLPGAFASGLDGTAVLMALAAGALCFAGGVVLFVTRLFGGGDVKMLAAAAPWAGWDGLATYLVLVALSGGLLSGMVLIFRALPVPPAWLRARWVARLHRRGAALPYGVAIAAGALILVPRVVLGRLGG